MSDAGLGKVTKHARLHGVLARKLGVHIVTGRAQPGDILAGEVVSSEELHVSRSTYREAVRSLAAKGLVRAKPKVGTTVCAVEQWHLLDPDVLSWALEADADPNLLHNLFELRTCVEPAAAALAATRRTAHQLDLMRDALDRMERLTLAAEDGRQADCDFHAAVLKASANPFLIALTDGVGTVVRITTIFKQRKLPPQRNCAANHARVFRAILGKNPEGASQQMRKLITLAQREMAAAVSHSPVNRLTRVGL